MKWLKSKSECCGCGACMQACPQNCIQMEEDEEGFLYPVIDVEKCTCCGVCEHVCPVICKQQRTYKEKVYGASSRDKELLKRSSSGGMFGELSQYVLQKGGVVFGCCFDDNMVLRHCTAENEAECKRFHGSKYVQSNTEETFRECKKYLKEGRYVLYTGTPCQIAGLKQYLRIDYEKLLTVELICHGVPSPGMWNQYIREVENEKNRKICNAAFRFQDQGWKTFRFKVDYADGETEVYPGTQNAFMVSFLNNLTLRPSCYNCNFRLDYSQGDIMIGDFWGVGNYYQKFDETLGVSAVITLSGKGESVFHEIKDKIQYLETDWSKVLPANGCVKLSVFPNRNREKIVDAYVRKDNLTRNMRKYAVNYQWGQERYTIGAWGSYNIRLVTQFLINGTCQRRSFHYSNSSIASLMSDVRHIEQTIEMENRYRKTALVADWEKSFRLAFETIVAQTDYFFIDLLEERFDLLICEDTILTDSDALRDSGIVPSGLKVCQMKALDNGIWEDKMQRFVNMLLSKFDASHIILTEVYLNKRYMDGGCLYNFDGQEEIRRTNQTLHKLYKLFKECCPEAQVVTLQDELQYTDINHRYGCYPYHFNYKAYFALADQIFNIMVESNE